MKLRRYLNICLALLGFGAAGAQPVANFVPDQVTGCPPLIVNLSNSSSGFTSSQWTLGNGNTSTQTSPSATYLSPGTYSIKLVVTNASGQKDSITKTVHVFVPPTAQFTAADTSGCSPFLAQFTDQSIPGEAPIVNYAWDFSGPSAQTVPNPNANYTIAGNWQITLVVQDGNGCVDNEIKPNYIHTGIPVVASFNASPLSSCNAPQAVTFNSTSTGPIAFTDWIFGDGATGSGVSTSHTYGPGDFDAKLILTSDLGCKDSTFQHVHVTSLPVGFSASDTVICAGSTVSFTDQSGPSTGWNWSFGPAGATSSQQNPSYTYTTPGTYAVSLITTGGTCNGFLSKPNYITVLPAPPADFTSPDTTSCKAPLTSNFTSTSTGAVSYSWDFGDGHVAATANAANTYSNTGTFTVQFVANYASGCSSVVTKVNYVKIIPPTANFEIVGDSGCIPLTVAFADSGLQSSSAVSVMQWDFGDGGGFQNGSHTAQHTYTTPGFFFPRLFIQTVDGCVDTFSGGPVKTGTPPMAAFTADPLVQCLGNKVHFTNQSTNGHFYLWDFGDGSSTEFEPVRKFIDTGFHTIRLTVFNNGCRADSVRKDYIYSPIPKADFLVVPDCTDPFTVTFVDTSIKADTWSWWLGDSTSVSGVRTFSHTFSALGSQTAQLVVTNAGTGCNDTLIKSFVLGISHSGFTIDTPLVGCAPFLVHFHDTSAGATSYLWRFGDGATSSAANPGHTYNGPGIFTVTQIINPGSQCPDSMVYVDAINVKGVAVNFAADTTAGCVPFTVHFSDSSRAFNSTISKFKWTFGDGYVDSVNEHPIHTYSNWGVYNVSLTTTNSQGCTEMLVRTAYINLKRPVPAFTFDTIFCPGDSVAFNNNSSSEVTSYLWNFGDGATSTLANPKHAYQALGYYQVSLQVFNKYGCDSFFMAPSKVHIDTPQVDFQVAATFSPCPPFVATFANTSNRKDLRWHWDFGDGKTDTIENPTNVYFFPGLYTVRLIGTSKTGCTDTIVYPELIRVLGPRGNVTVTPTMGCAPVTVAIGGTITDAIHPYVCDLGNGTLLNDSVNFHFTYNDAGVYHPRYILKDTVGCIVSYYLDSVTVLETPKFRLPADTSVCEGTAVSFNLMAGDHFAWSPSTGVDCDTCRSVLINASDTTVYVVRMTSNNGCFSEDTITLNVDALPAPDAGPDITVCRNETVQLHAGPVSKAVWTPPTYLNSVNTINPKSTPGDSITYTITAFNVLHCSVTDQVHIRVIDKVVMDAMPDTAVCDGSVVPLWVSVTDSSVSGMKYKWMPANALDNDSISNPMASISRSATFTVIGTSGTCAADTETVVVTNVAIPDIKAGDDAVVTPGATVDLYATSHAKNVHYSWQFPSGDAATCSNCRVPRLTANSSQLAIATVTNSLGCSNSDTVHITVRSCNEDAVFVPNLFSPNGDGENDRLYARSILLDHVDFFRVLDRWGKVVFETSDLKEGWDGKIDGLDAQSDVFVYTMEAGCNNGEKLHKKGTVTLVR
ncbi:MAG: PKD domain-containing protein [Chitinophagales bacterium]